jgi:hypothetical protein
MDNYGQPWTAKQDALLGTETDRSVAEKLGRTSASVAIRRVKLGIKSPREKRLSDSRGSR